MTKAAISSAVVAAGLLVLGTSAQAQTASDLGNPTGSGDGSVLAQSPALGGKAAGEDAERNIDRTLKSKRAVVAESQEQASDPGNPSGSGDGGVLAQSPALGGKAAGEDAERSIDRTLKGKRTVVADNQEQATDLGNPSGSGDGGVLAQSPALGGKANGKSVVQLEDRALRLKSTN